MEELVRYIRRELERRGRLLLAIDGRCGCGKSTLAARLAADFGGSVVHTDDFYLPFAARKTDWREGVAANMDLLRLRDEVLVPLRRGERARCRAYDCGEDRFLPPRVVAADGLVLLEGSYSAHPLLRAYYDGCVFVTASPETQRARLRAREGEKYPAFETLWIPLEERYFAAFGIEERADFVIVTDAP